MDAAEDREHGTAGGRAIAFDALAQMYLCKRKNHLPEARRSRLLPQRDDAAQGASGHVALARQVMHNLRHESANWARPYGYLSSRVVNFIRFYPDGPGKSREKDGFQNRGSLHLGKEASFALVCGARRWPRINCGWAHLWMFRKNNNGKRPSSRLAA